MKKKRNKKYNIYNRGVNILKGIVMKWTVIDPLADSEINSYSKIYHKNPIHRLFVNKIKHDIIEITSKRRLLYHVTVSCIFEDAFGKEYIRAKEMQVDGVLRGADDTYFQIVEDIFAESNMNQYKHTEIRIEILGQGKIKDEYFTEDTKPKKFSSTLTA